MGAFKDTFSISRFLSHVLIRKLPKENNNNIYRTLTCTGHVKLFTYSFYRLKHQEMDTELLSKLPKGYTAQKRQHKNSKLCSLALESSFLTYPLDCLPRGKESFLCRKSKKVFSGY